MDEQKYQKIILFLLDALELEHYGLRDEFAEILKYKFDIDVKSWKSEDVSEFPIMH